jgi:hypothetical protein
MRSREGQRQLYPKYRTSQEKAGTSEMGQKLPPALQKRLRDLPQNQTCSPDRDRLSKPGMRDDR